MSITTSATPTLPEVDEELEKALRRIERLAIKLYETEADRDQAILIAREMGASLRQIAAVAGMSHVGIKKLVTRHLHPKLIAEIDAELPDDE